MFRLTTILLVGFCTLLVPRVHAQGGPPMITDDPGTPGNGHWENNIAFAFERRSHEASFEFPAIDLNYGWGDRIQLTLQTSAALLKRSGRGAIGGLGGAEAAVKWRFLDRDGVQMSMFPRVLFNVLQSSVRRGLAQGGTRFQLPVQLAKKFGAVDLDGEIGMLASSVGRSEFLYGIVAGLEVTERTSVMAEVHGTARTNFSRDVLTVNFGMRHKVTDACLWIASLGHEVRSPESLAFIGYGGVQLLY